MNDRAKGGTGVTANTCDEPLTFCADPKLSDTSRTRATRHRRNRRTHRKHVRRATNVLRGPKSSDGVMEHDGSPLWVTGFDDKLPVAPRSSCRVVMGHGKLGSPNIHIFTIHILFETRFTRDYYIYMTQMTQWTHKKQNRINDEIPQ